MNKPKWSVVAICKNEERTIPKLTASLEEFKTRGGDLNLLDTGSTDNSVQVAKDLGWKVTKVGTRFVTTIDDELAHKLNKRFVVEGEPQIVKGGDTLFDFASARNYISSLAQEQMVCTLDCDEAYTVYNINALNELIEKGYDQFEYSFVYAHDSWGKPAVEFIQSKFYNRKKLKWTGIIHEILTPINE